MTRNNVDFERDLSDAFAPVTAPSTLKRRLLQIPHLHAQHRGSVIERWLSRVWGGGFSLISGRSVLGLTTTMAAACCSLVIGFNLGLDGFLPQGQAVQTTIQARSSTPTGTAGDANDAVAMLYAAADLPGDLP